MSSLSTCDGLHPFLTSSGMGVTCIGPGGPQPASLPLGIVFAFFRDTVVLR